MASKITKIKIKQDDGSFVSYPLGVNSECVTLDDEENLQEWIDSLKLELEWEPISDT